MQPDLQHVLLEWFTGRTVEIVGSLLILGGPPTSRDTSLYGPVGDLPRGLEDA